MVTKKKIDKDNEALEKLAKGNLGVGGQLVRMTEGTFEESGLDPETFMLVRIAALTAMDASPISWYVNLKVGKEIGIPPENALGTLMAISPIVGTARVVSAAGSITKALKLDESIENEESSNSFHNQI